MSKTIPIGILSDGTQEGMVLSEHNRACGIGVAPTLSPQLSLPLLFHQTTSKPAHQASPDPLATPPAYRGVNGTIIEQARAATASFWNNAPMSQPAVSSDSTERLYDALGQAYVYSRRKVGVHWRQKVGRLTHQQRSTVPIRTSPLSGSPTSSFCMAPLLG